MTTSMPGTVCRESALRCDCLRGYERHLNLAIEEMVFTGGTLNLKLLGGSATELGTAADI